MKEIHALSAREKAKLLKQLDGERERAEAEDDVRLFDEAHRETTGEKPTSFRQFLKRAKIKV